MIRNTNGARLESETLLPHVRTERFPEGYGELWLPEKPIEDITQWTKRNLDEILDTTKKAGCIKVKAKLQTKKSQDPPREITWQNLDWFEGTYDLTQIPHWDWAKNDPIEVIVLGQQDWESPRKYPTCNAPTEIVGSALSVASKKARKSGEKFPETVDSMINVLSCIRSPEQGVVLLSNCFEVARNDAERTAYAAIINLLRHAYSSIRENTVVHDWQSEPGTVLFIYTGTDTNTQFSPVVHWAMPCKFEIPKNNLWRAPLYLDHTD